MTFIKDYFLIEEKNYDYYIWSQHRRTLWIRLHWRVKVAELEDRAKQALSSELRYSLHATNNLRNLPLKRIDQQNERNINIIGIEMTSFNESNSSGITQEGVISSMVIKKPLLEREYWVVAEPYFVSMKGRPVPWLSLAAIAFAVLLFLNTIFYIEKVPEISVISSIALVFMFFLFIVLLIIMILYICFNSYFKEAYFIIH